MNDRQSSAKKILTAVATAAALGGGFAVGWLLRGEASAAAHICGQTPVDEANAPAAASQPRGTGDIEATGPEATLATASPAANAVDRADEDADSERDGEGANNDTLPPQAASSQPPAHQPQEPQEDATRWDWFIVATRVFLALAFVIGMLSLGVSMLERKDAAVFGSVQLTLVAVSGVVFQIIWAVLRAHSYERWYVFEVYVGATSAIALLIGLSGGAAATTAAIALTVLALAGWAALQILNDRGVTQSCWIWDFDPDWRQDRMRVEHKRLQEVDASQKAWLLARWQAVRGGVTRVRDWLRRWPKRGGSSTP